MIRRATGVATLARRVRHASSASTSQQLRADVAYCADLVRCEREGGGQT